MSFHSFADRAALERHQEARLQNLLRLVLQQNPFQRTKYLGISSAGGGPPAVGDLPGFPYTTKRELAEDQLAHPPFGTNLTFPLEHYTRMHQTSGTTGEPLRWLDTADSWRWFRECWKVVLRRAGLKPLDRCYFAFSFGPFIGFWSAFEAAQEAGALVLTGGAQTSQQRLQQIVHLRATVLLATPTYALHLAQVARELGLDLARSDVRTTIHAGEPGASLPHVRARLAEAWGARVFDHAGATEVGAWGLPGDQQDCLVINEAEFIAEVIDPSTLEVLRPPPGGRVHGELVLTNLGRAGSPVLRYRTGDLVELEREGDGEPPVARLRGGVLGRADDMLLVRGTNVYPSAIDDVVRSQPAIDEYEITIDRRAALTEVVVRIEALSPDPAASARALADALHQRLLVRIAVETVPPATLPRHELKARRLRIL